MSSQAIQNNFLAIYQDLNAAIDGAKLEFQEPVIAAYNPLEYAWDGFEKYVRKYLRYGVRNVFLGMNPGPWGMAQTGVPFGEVNFVRDWLNLRDIVIRKPINELDSYKILGLDCKRSEVSGKRLWGLFRDEFAEPENFFAENFVLNYCPLLFIARPARNLTPDKIKLPERKILFGICDGALRKILEILRPENAIGIGNFAESRLLEVMTGSRVVKILHPSPASPLSAKNWDVKAKEKLIASGVWR
mgnify:CR=1 FL=1